MKLRAFASVGLFFTTAVVTVTGIALLFKGIPLKVYMEMGHEIFSFAFIAFMLIHTVLNITPLTNYFKSKMPKVPFSAAAATNSAIAVALLAITIFGANSMTKERQNMAAYPSVENIPLATVVLLAGIDYDSAINALEQEGYKIPTGDLTLNALSQANETSPRVIYAKMTAAAQDVKVTAKNDQL